VKTPFYKLYAFYVALAGLAFVILKNTLVSFPFTVEDLIGLLVFLVGLFGWQVEQALHSKGFFKA
jgi:hypothetical protein